MESRSRKWKVEVVLMRKKVRNIIIKTQKKTTFESFDSKMGCKGQDVRKCLFYGLFSKLDTPSFQLAIFPYTH